MKKYEVEVVRTDHYVIEIDEEQFNEEWMADFRKVFYDLDTLEQHVENIALQRSRMGNSFIEGYGVPLVNGKVPRTDYEDSIQHGINIIVKSEDDDHDIYSREVK